MMTLLIAKRSEIISMGRVFKKASTNFLAEAFAREERLERPTPGFGDQCSTN